MSSRAVSIRDAAGRLGVSVDTVRTYERDGRLSAERSPGGHRRFLPEELDRFMADVEEDHAERYDLGSDDDDLEGLDLQERPRAARERAAPVVPEWESKEKHARAAVEVAKAERERRKIQLEEEREAEELKRAASAEEARQAEALRLSRLKAYGRAYAAQEGAPPALRAKVVADLETWVRARQLPVHLASDEAEELVRARVERLLAGWRTRMREEEEAKRAAAETERLISGGMHHARHQTSSWGADDRHDVLELVQSDLEDEVDETWSRAQVNDLVEQTLDEWEDEGDEDDD